MLSAKMRFGLEAAFDCCCWAVGMFPETGLVNGSDPEIERGWVALIMALVLLIE